MLLRQRLICICPYPSAFSLIRWSIDNFYLVIRSCCFPYNSLRITCYIRLVIAMITTKRRFKASILKCWIIRNLSCCWLTGLISLFIINFHLVIFSCPTIKRCIQTFSIFWNVVGISGNLTAYNFCPVACSVVTFEPLITGCNDGFRNIQCSLIFDMILQWKCCNCHWHNIFLYTSLWALTLIRNRCLCPCKCKCRNTLDVIFCCNHISVYTYFSICGISNFFHLKSCLSFYELLYCNGIQINFFCQCFGINLQLNSHFSTRRLTGPVFIFKWHIKSLKSIICCLTICQCCFHLFIMFCCLPFGFQRRHWKCYVRWQYPICGTRFYRNSFHLFFRSENHIFSTLVTLCTCSCLLRQMPVFQTFPEASTKQAPLPVHAVL